MYDSCLHPHILEICSVGRVSSHRAASRMGSSRGLHDSAGCAWHSETRASCAALVQNCLFWQWRCAAYRGSVLEARGTQTRERPCWFRWHLVASNQGRPHWGNIRPERRIGVPSLTCFSLHSSVLVYCGPQFVHCQHHNVKSCMFLSTSTRSSRSVMCWTSSLINSHIFVTTR